MRAVIYEYYETSQICKNTLKKNYNFFFINNSVEIVRTEGVYFLKLERKINLTKF